MKPDIYDALSMRVATGKETPKVWVRRLVVYERLQPEPVVIRDIPLSRGLNIIWAEESADDSEDGKITGHSAGKTTFCRLLRYCLGEATFGTGNNQDLIRRWFPDGYVAIELWVNDKLWSVLRPFGKNRRTAVKFSSTIEDLIKDRRDWVGQEQLAKKLGLEDILTNMATSAILRTQQPILWAHTLAWCMRDQEARFQTVHDWRSPRSESGTPSFEFPKADPLFVMRTVLGLFAHEELVREENLAKAQKDVERLERQVEDLRREPEYRVNLCRTQLCQRLKELFPQENDIAERQFQADELRPDLDRLTNNGIADIQKNIDELINTKTTFQNIIDTAGGDIKSLETQKTQMDVLFKIQEGGLDELNAGIVKRDKVRDDLKDNIDKICPFGDVIFSDCYHVRQRQNTLEITELQDVHTLEQAEAQRAELQRKIGNEESRLQARIDETTRTRDDAKKRRDAIQENIDDKRIAIDSLRHLRDDLATWVSAYNKVGTYEKLDQAQKSLATAQENVKKLGRELANLLNKHDTNRELLTSIFAASVRAVLPNSGHDGLVAFEGRDLAFRITNGPAMSGEAVETLSVLLADLTCLVYNSVSDQCHLPGIFLHDSPREADLATRLYRNFILFAAALQNHFGSADACPFQYIITTTTPPPEKLRNADFVKLSLNAGVESELLFRRNIARTPPSKEKINDLFGDDSIVNVTREQ